MNIYYSDENERLTPEIRKLMEAALERALILELAELESLNFSDLAEGEYEGFAREEIGVEVGVTVVSSDEIRSLNNEYRGIDRVTDVLSFPQYDDIEELAADIVDPETEALLGDVVICYDRAAEQAEEYGTGLTRELVYLFCHSILHLLGYDHMEDDERRIMREREELIMGQIGVTR